MRVLHSGRLAALAGALLAPTLALATPARAQLSTPLDSAMLASFQWRNIGPANIAGRVTDIEGIGSPSKTFFVASAGGGIWKTTNNGTTFKPVFDVGRVVAMGDLAIAPSDTMQVWAGTGEGNTRNSISPGGGIYKSTDGGMTWALMGLEETQVIARVLVDPRNADVVYAAALGHIWDSNPERGLYKTTDGGRTWQLKKFISDKAGFADIVMDPRNPDILFASSWQRVRGPWFLDSGGPGSGLWKSTDAGETWTEVVGNGFPTAMKGRIGLAISPSRPDIMYALVEAEKETDGSGGSGLYRTDDAGATWQKMNDENTRPFYYSQVRVDPANPDRVYWSSTPVRYSNDGGRTAGNATVGIHVDQHAMWIDPNDPQHFVTGNDGGIAQTWDQGGSFEFINTFAIGQLYHVSFNMDVPYQVCGGLQDNGSWCGPSRRARGGIDNYMWATVAGGDGFYSAQHPELPYLVWAESQGGNMSRVDMRTGQRVGLQKPQWRDRYLEFEDSILVIWDDSTHNPPADAQRRIERIRQEQQADSAARELRWNWDTPFFLSPHDPDVFYAGANRVLKSTKLGDDLRVISPDLSTQDPGKIHVSTETTGGITPDVTGAETHATIVTLDESPIVQGMLFAGTDDGNVWMSPDDGARWTQLNDRFTGKVPDSTYVSRIEPSSFDRNRFYVTFDNHRRNDFTPYVFVTDDGGKSFRSIAGGLPSDGPAYVHVIREDPTNPNLLFVGTDLGVWVSTDRGGSWQRFMSGMPTVPVRDLEIHPRDRELIAATHGRSIWIVDIAPLQQMTDQVMAQGAVLFEPAPGLEFGDRPIGGESTGHKWFEGESRPYGAAISYYLPADVEGRQVELTITGLRRQGVRDRQRCRPSRVADGAVELPGRGPPGGRAVACRAAGQPPVRGHDAGRGRFPGGARGRRPAGDGRRAGEHAFRRKSALPRLRWRGRWTRGRGFRPARRDADGALPGRRPGSGRLRWARRQRHARSAGRDARSRHGLQRAAWPRWPERAHGRGRRLHGFHDGQRQDAERAVGDHPPGRPAARRVALRDVRGCRLVGRAVRDARRRPVGVGRRVLKQ